MNTTLILQIIVLIVLLYISAFFSSSETALMSVNRLRLRDLADQGDKRAKRVLKLIENPGKMLSAILIGNNIANLTASALSTSIAMKLFGSVAVGIATGILTVLVLIFGEITPKTMATYRAEKMAMRFAPVIYALMTILTPVIFVVNQLASLVLRLLGVKSDHAQNAVTESEIRSIMKLGHESGVIEDEEKEIINNVFDFTDATVREVMVPRIDVDFLDVHAGYSEVLSCYKECRHTRIPVYEDTSDNVIGILNVKDLLLVSPEHFALKGLLRKAFFTYEHKNTSDLFYEMQRESISMAIVLDDYGSTAGLITLEDLIEELVGEIHDEFDTKEAYPIEQIAEGEYLIEGATDLDDINDQLDLHLTSDDYESIGGFIIEHFDRIPKAREAFYTEDGVFLQVRSKSGHKIEQVLLILPDKKE